MNKQELINKVIEQIKADISFGDVTAIDEMFVLLLNNPDNEEILLGYLPETIKK